MTNPTIIPANEARSLLEAATPGPWRMEVYRERDAIHIDAPRGDSRIGHDSWEGLAIVYGCEDDRRAGDAAAHGNASLICAAHDLAQTVVQLHAEVERAASNERARIVALLTERSAATREHDGRESSVSLTYRQAAALIVAKRLRDERDALDAELEQAALDDTLAERKPEQPKRWRSPIVQRAHDEADHDYREVLYDRDDRPIRPTCAYCGRSRAYCKERRP